MIKKTVYLFATLFVIFGLMAFAAPASAATSAATTRLIVGGRIVAFNATAKTLTVKPVVGKAVFIKTSAATMISRAGKVAKFANLRVGDKIDVRFNLATKLASSIKATPSIYVIRGTLKAINPALHTIAVASNMGGTSVVVRVSASTVFIRHGVRATFAALVVGDKLQTKYNSGTMLASENQSEAEDGEVYGTISAVDTVANTVSITPEMGGADVVLNVNASTVIKRGDTFTTLDKLQVGDKAEAKYDTTTMIASLIETDYQTGEVHGTVAAVDTVANTVTITPETGGADVTLNIDSSTLILRNDTPATLADLLVGDKVEAKYDTATMIASVIQTEVEDGELKGTIAAVDTVANTVTITPNGGGADIVLNVNTSTVILRHDAPATLADLLVGDTIEAKYDSTTMIASLLQAQ